MYSIVYYSGRIVTGYKRVEYVLKRGLELALVATTNWRSIRRQIRHCPKRCLFLKRCLCLSYHPPSPRYIHTRRRIATIRSELDPSRTFRKVELEVYYSVGVDRLMVDNSLLESS